MAASADRIEELRQRAGRCRCKYCGGRLEIRRIIYGSIEDARVEIFCSVCDRIEYGIEPEIYQAAQYFVEELGFNAYPDLGESAKTKQMSIAKTCEMMAWVCKYLGFVDQTGFKTPLEKRQFLGEALLLEDDEVAALCAQKEQLL